MFREGALRAYMGIVGSGRLATDAIGGGCWLRSFGLRGGWSPMAYAFNYRAKNTPGIGELLSDALPHFDALIVPFEPGQEVTGEGDPTENFFLVMRGLFRGVKFTRDGRRQVFAFYMPGDLCGLEPEGSHKLTIEAVDCAAMAILPRHACRFRMNDDPELNAALFDGATRALTLTIDHMMMIGRSSAEERLAWFLTMLAARSACPNAQVLDLAMQRQDIADYLGLTIETVSRTFTLFRDRGLVSLPHKRRVLILRPDALARLAAADRDAAPIGAGQSDEDMEAAVA
jgi:CRP/FNR family transcriptional regulator, nitrogen fixation regulation protein